MTTLTPRDVAADLHLSVDTVLAHLKAGRIGGGFQIIPDGPWRVDDRAYDAWKAEASAPIDPHRIPAPSARSRAATGRTRT